jgi:PAS domain S-box-containing protein
MNKNGDYCQTSEKLFKSLTASFPGVVYQFSATRDFVYRLDFISQKATDIFGLGPDPVTFWNEFAEHIPDNEKEGFFQSIREAVERVAPWNYEGRFIRPDGKVIWFSGDSVPQEEGETIVFNGLLMDITRRKEMESSLRRTQFCFDHAAIGIYQIGMDGRILDVNGYAAEMLGYTIEELKELSVFNIDPSLNEGTLEEDLDNIAVDDRGIFETVHIRKDGSRIDVEISSNIMEYEGQQYSFSFVKDITEKKRIEASLRLTQFIFDKAPITIWRIGEAGEILDVNEQSSTTLGYTREELCRMTVFDISPGLTKAEVEKSDRKLMETGTGMLETIQRRKNGEIFPILSITRLMYYNNQKIRVAFVQDITERKRAEASLRLTQFIFDKAPIGIWRMGPAGEVLDVNEQACASLGYTREELCRMTVFDFSTSMEREAVDAGFRELQKAGTAIFEDFHRRRNGEIFPVQVISNLIRYNNQEMSVAFVHNITERKQAEAALRENEQLLGNILESMNDGIAVLDTGLKYKVFNKRAEKMFGKKRQDVLGKTPWEVFSLTENSEILDPIRSAMKGHVVGSVDSQVSFPPSINAWFRGNFSPLREEDGSVNGVVGVISDITRQKRDEEELRRLRNYLSNIIDSMPSQIIGVDGDGFITQWNRTVEQKTGISADQARGRSVTDVLPWTTSEMRKISKGIASRKTIQDQRIPRNRNGGIAYEDVTIYPLIANGVDGAVIRVDDVTQRVRMEEMMVQSEKMLSVGGLAAGMAHEINNPLAGMMQTAEVMAGRLGGNLDLPANRRAAEAAGVSLEGITRFMEARGIPRMLGAITESGKRVAGIVHNMLSFARKTDDMMSSHDLESLLDKTVELAATDYDLKKEYDFKRIEIRRDYAGNLPEVPCEAGKIQQVLLNIFRNGTQAMQEAEISSPRFIIRTKVDEGRGMAIMEIEDNGPGMDEETRKRVFEPFFTTKPVGVGTGLGLSVSYFIITENHGGDMTVDSRPGAGATFIIRLPLHGIAEQSPAL